MYFLQKNVWISINISRKFVSRGPINKIPALVQIMAWRRPGDKPLSEPMLVFVPTHICVTGPQWVKWKHALVAPVYKKEDKYLASNYRPVSLTVVCCKLLEHCVCNHTLQHLENHNLLTSLQHGFRRRHSCETQLLLTYDDLIGSFVRGIQTDMAILDFSHAFDTVPHERLLGKLASYGVGGILNDWVRSFLLGRTMTVVVDVEESAQPINVLSGVPQVTVLPPYYSLCILMTSLIKCPQVPSVDYLQLTACYTGPYTHWRTNSSCSVILMHFRGGPSCGVCGSAESSKMPCFYNLCDTVLLSVTDSKYLGIRLSEDLGRGVQVDAACEKANTKLHFIQRNLNSAPKRSKELAFEGLVRSGLDYCSTVWDPHHKCDINRLLFLTRWGRDKMAAIFRLILIIENAWISINISLKLVPRGPINNIPALVQIKAWRRPGDKTLS